MAGIACALAMVMLDGSSIYRIITHTDPYEMVQPRSRLMSQASAGIALTGQAAHLCTMDILNPVEEERARCFAENAVRNVYNIDFVHYHSQLEQAATAFSPAGWQSFEDALRQAGLIASIEGNRYVVDANIATSRITGIETIQGHRAWHVSMPMTLTYSSADKSTSTALDVDAVVLEDSGSVGGLAMTQILARMA